jgi:hypothetical protein
LARKAATSSTATSSAAATSCDREGFTLNYEEQDKN